MEINKAVQRDMESDWEQTEANTFVTCRNKTINESLYQQKNNTVEISINH